MDINKVIDSLVYVLLLIETWQMMDCIHPNGNARTIKNTCVGPSDLIIGIIHNDTLACMHSLVLGINLIEEK